jgi:NADPH-ferrihemoprotein reductase
MELDLEATGLSHQTGDHLGVSVVNPDIEVEAFLKLFGLWSKKNTVISIKSPSEHSIVPIPLPIRYEDAARCYLDICGPVSRQMIGMLAECTTEPAKKDALCRLGRDGDMFMEKTHGLYFNLASFIATTFPSDPTLEVPFAVLLEGLPKLQPRFYSISSSSSLDKAHVSLTVALDFSPFPNPLLGCSMVSLQTFFPIYPQGRTGTR